MKRRILTFLLSAAMMLTSVQLPVNAAPVDASDGQVAWEEQVSAEETVVEETVSENTGSKKTAAEPTEPVVEEVVTETPAEEIPGDADPAIISEDAVIEETVEEETSAEVEEEKAEAAAQQDDFVLAVTPDSTYGSKATVKLTKPLASTYTFTNYYAVVTYTDALGCTVTSQKKVDAGDLSDTNGITFYLSNLPEGTPDQTVKVDLYDTDGKSRNLGEDKIWTGTSDAFTTAASPLHGMTVAIDSINYDRYDEDYKAVVRVTSGSEQNLGTTFPIAFAYSVPGKNEWTAFEDFEGTVDCTSAGTTWTSGDALFSDDLLAGTGYDIKASVDGVVSGIFSLTTADIPVNVELSTYERGYNCAIVRYDCTLTDRKESFYGSIEISYRKSASDEWEDAYMDEYGEVYLYDSQRSCSRRGYIGGIKPGQTYQVRYVLKDNYTDKVVKTNESSPFTVSTLADNRKAAVETTVIGSTTAMIKYSMEASKTHDDSYVYVFYRKGSSGAWTYAQNIRDEEDDAFGMHYDDIEDTTYFVDTGYSQISGLDPNETYEIRAVLADEYYSGNYSDMPPAPPATGDTLPEGAKKMSEIVSFKTEAKTETKISLTQKKIGTTEVMFDYVLDTGKDFVGKYFYIYCKENNEGSWTLVPLDNIVSPDYGMIFSGKSADYDEDDKNYDYFGPIRIKGLKADTNYSFIAEVKDEVDGSPSYGKTDVDAESAPVSVKTVKEDKKLSIDIVDEGASSAKINYSYDAAGDQLTDVKVVVYYKTGSGDWETEVRWIYLDNPAGSIEIKRLNANAEYSVIAEVIESSVSPLPSTPNTADKILAKSGDAKTLKTKEDNRKISLNVVAIGPDYVKLQAVYAPGNEKDKGGAVKIYIEGSESVAGNTSVGQNELVSNVVTVSKLQPDTKYNFYAKLLETSGDTEVTDSKDTPVKVKTLAGKKTIGLFAKATGYTSAALTYSYDDAGFMASSKLYVWYKSDADGATWQLKNKNDYNNFYTLNKSVAGENISLTGLAPGKKYEAVIELVDGTPDASYTTGATKGPKKDDSVYPFKTATFTTPEKKTVVKHEYTADETSAKLTFTLENAVYDRNVLTIKLTDKNSTTASVIVCNEAGVQIETNRVSSIDVDLLKDSKGAYTKTIIVKGLTPGDTYTVTGTLYEYTGGEDPESTNLTAAELGTFDTKAATAATSVAVAEDSYKSVVLNVSGAADGTKAVRIPLTIAPEHAINKLTIAVTKDGTAAAGVLTGSFVTEDGKDYLVLNAASGAGSEYDVKIMCGESELAALKAKVVDYKIKIGDTFTFIGTTLSLTKGQERTLVVTSTVSGTEAKYSETVEWSVDNANSAKIGAADGKLTALNYGNAVVTAKTKDGIVITQKVSVSNKFDGISIRVSTDTGYSPIADGENKYKIVADEDYILMAVASPANSGSIGFNTDYVWEGEDLTVLTTSNGSARTILNVPSGKTSITLTAKQKKAEGASTAKECKLTFTILPKATVVTPETYVWLNTTNKLKDVKLPDKWTWNDPTELVYYNPNGYYDYNATFNDGTHFPVSDKVRVYFINDKAVTANNVNGGELGSYRQIGANPQKIFVKTGSSVYMTGGVPVDSTGIALKAALYESSGLTTKSAQLGITKKGDGSAAYYDIKPSKAGTYAVVNSITRYDPKFTLGDDGSYTILRGDKVGKAPYTITTTIVADDAVPVNSIDFSYPDSLPTGFRKVAGGIEYEITGEKTKIAASQAPVAVTMDIRDIAGSVVDAKDRKFIVKSSDTSVAKVKQDGSKINVTIQKNANGLAKIDVQSKDQLATVGSFDISVKNYEPKMVKSETVSLNTAQKNIEKLLAYVLLPYGFPNAMKDITLVKAKGSDDKVDGIVVTRTAASVANDGLDKSYNVYVQIGGDKTADAGNKSYWLKVETEKYETVWLPVKLKIANKLPNITVKQNQPVNLFYTNTVGNNRNDDIAVAKAHGLMQVSASDKTEVKKVVWRPTTGGKVSEAPANTDILIDDDVTAVTIGKKRDNYYIIRQNDPELKNKKAYPDAVTGNLFVYLEGYDDPIEKKITIKTTYKAPKLSVDAYKLCPAAEQITQANTVYTSAYGTGKNKRSLASPGRVIGTHYDSSTCENPDVLFAANSAATLTYTGEKNPGKVPIKFYSDKWAEPLTVNAKVSVSKLSLGLAPAAVTLNSCYPVENKNTGVRTGIINKNVKNINLAVDSIKIEAAKGNKGAQDILDKGYVNISANAGSRHVYVSVNNAAVIDSGAKLKGNYKYKITPVRGGKELGSATLTVKIIDKPAAVTVKTTGKMDLSKLENGEIGYTHQVGVKLTPKFSNLNTNYRLSYNAVTNDQIPDNVWLEGEYAGLFTLLSGYNDNTYQYEVYAVPKAAGQLKAGKAYKLYVCYSIEDANGQGAGSITVRSAKPITIKPTQSAPKPKLAEMISATEYKPISGVVLYNSGTGTADAYLDPGKNYMIEDIDVAYSQLDVNKDGDMDIIVTCTTARVSAGDPASINVAVNDMNVLKAGATYNVPVKVLYYGRDGVSKDAVMTIKVQIKK